MIQTTLNDGHTTLGDDFLAAMKAPAATVWEFGRQVEVDDLIAKTRPPEDTTSFKVQRRDAVMSCRLT